MSISCTIDTYMGKQARVFWNALHVWGTAGAFEWMFQFWRDNSTRELETEFQNSDFEHIILTSRIKTIVKGLICYFVLTFLPSIHSAFHQPSVNIHPSMHLSPSSIAFIPLTVHSSIHPSTSHLPPFLFPTISSFFILSICAQHLTVRNAFNNLCHVSYIVLRWLTMFRSCDWVHKIKLIAAEFPSQF